MTTPERPDWRQRIIAGLHEARARNKVHGLNDVAAGLSFWAILSLFPTLLAFAGILGSLELFIGKSAAQTLRQNITDFLDRTLPPGSEITTTITDVINQSRAGLAVVGFASAVWGMSKGFAGFFRALARVDGRLGAQSGIKGRLVGLLLGLATIGVMTIALLQIVVGPLLGFEKLLPTGGSVVLSIWTVVRWPVLAALLVLWLTTLFHVGPGHGPGMRWRDRLPGAVLAMVAWAVVTLGFGLYVQIIGGANPVLGVLGGAIVSLTWLYLLALSTLLGAELNAVLADQRRAILDGAPVATAHREVAPAPPAVGAGLVAAAFLLGRRRGR